MLSKETFNLIAAILLKAVAVGSGLGALFLLFCPEGRAEKINRLMNRWISLRQATRWLDIMVHVDNKIMKGRLILGIISLLISIVLFYIYFKYRLL
jgi:hypothetical protein